MCGHSIIDSHYCDIAGTNYSKTAGQLRLETPAGLVKISYKSENNKVKSK